MQPVDDGDDQARQYPLERLGANLNPGQRLGCPAALLFSGLKGCSGSEGLLSANWAPCVAVTRSLRVLLEVA